MPRPRDPDAGLPGQLDLPQARRVYSVTEVNVQIHELLEASFPELWVEGEVSNCRAYPSGHTYLTLKDETSQLRAVLFRGAAAGVRFRLEDGLKILARVRVSSYIARGELQLILLSVEPREKGALQLAFEQLKAKLEKEGLFAQERKKPLPPFPRHVGIVTSLQGAALHDMLSVLRRRWQGLEILIAPVPVQGEGAAQAIAAAIADLNRHAPETEVLLVGRGGGSMEDLWAFNEEAVARAIAASAIPVISCVGHETDFTIADFVADRRAPTPSAAAELAVSDKRSVLEDIRARGERMIAAIERRLERLEERLRRAGSHPLLQSPHRLYEQRMRRVDEISLRLPEAMRRLLANAERDLSLRAQKLEAYSPLKVLSRGYAIAEKLPGREILRSFRQAAPGDLIRVKLHEGHIHCEVTHARQTA